MFSPFTEQESRHLKWILAAGFVMRLALAFRPVSAMATAPFIEDAFYVFQAAWQLSLGHGISIDGIHPTNGIQPLIAFLYTPLYWIGGSKIMGLRLSFVLIGIIDCISAYLVARVVSTSTRGTSLQVERTPSAPVLAAGIWLFAYTFVVQTINGLETGLYSLLILVSILQYSRLRRRPNIREAIQMGIVLGFLVLARIDGAILTALYAAHYWWKGGKGSVGRSAIFSALALLISLPWWLYNLIDFGSIIPISGQAESLSRDLGENILRAFFTLSDIVVMVYNAPYYQVGHTLKIAWAVVVLPAALWLFHRYKLRDYLRQTTRLEDLTPIAWFSAILILYYTLVFNASWFLPRYFQPLRILALIVFTVLVSHLLYSLRGRAERITLYVITILAILFSAGQYLRSGYLRDSSDYYKVTEWFLSHEPHSTALFQSGTVSFFQPNVTNLDGKVNLDALHALKSDTLDKYVEAKQFYYLADWPLFLDPLLRSLNANGTQYELIDSVNIFRIYRRISPTP